MSRSIRVIAVSFCLVFLCLSCVCAGERKFESIDQYGSKNSEDLTKLSWLGVSTMLVYSAPNTPFSGYSLQGSLGPSFTFYLRNLLFCDFGINIEGFAFQSQSSNRMYYSANGKALLRFNGRAPDIAPGVGFFEIGGGVHVMAQNITMPTWNAKAYGLFTWGFGYEVYIFEKADIKVELSFVNCISPNFWMLDAPSFIDLGLGISFEL